METNLKNEIKQSGLTQKSIADRIGVTKEHLNSMINGKQDMPQKYRIEIVSLLNKLKPF